MWTFKTTVADRFVLHNAEQVDGPSTMSYSLCLCIQWYFMFKTHPNTWLTACVQPPPPPCKKSGKGAAVHVPGYSVWLKVIRYCVLPLQVSLLSVFTQHFHIEKTLRLQTALPRTFVHEHCSTTFSQTLHWWMTWKLFWSFNDSRSQRCCDTGCRDTSIIKANWLTWCNSCCGIFFTIAMGNFSEK